MKKPRRSRRGRGTPSEPWLTSPLPISPAGTPAPTPTPSPASSSTRAPRRGAASSHTRAAARAPRPAPNDGDEKKDLCSQGKNHHHHRRHGTSEGLAAHLSLYYGHDWPLRLVKQCGFDVVLEVLDTLTEHHGVLLDARRPAKTRQGSSMYGGTEKGELVVKNPAGLITRCVQALAAERAEAEAAVRRAQFRVVGGNDADR